MIRLIFIQYYSNLPILLAQIKAGNNSNKLKKRNETNIISFVSA